MRKIIIILINIIFTTNSFAIIANSNNKKKLMRLLPKKIHKYIGKIKDSGTAVYLGNNYVISASHVDLNEIIFNNRRYYPNKKSIKFYKNKNKSGFADIITFRLKIKKNDPLMKLKPLNISLIRPMKYTNLVMAGCGFTSSQNYVMTNRIKLKPQVYNSNLTWAHSGEFLLGKANVASNKNLWLKKSGLNTAIFYTEFINKPYFAQATSGDSGGCVFSYNYATKQWDICGIIIAFVGRPGISYYGNKTILCDISVYRSQILANIRRNY